MDEIGAFHDAWTRFGETCAATVAPESTYQAWFAHFLIEHFGVLRVVREADFGSRYLADEAQAAFPGHNLMVDVVILREPVVDLPKRASLASADSGDRMLRSGFGRLDTFSVITEMKVGTTQGKGLRHSSIVQDVKKLDAILRSAKRLFPEITLPAAFVCVLDNNKRHRLNRAHLEGRINREVPATTVQLLIHPA